MEDLELLKFITPEEFGEFANDTHNLTIEEMGFAIEIDRLFDGTLKMFPFQERKKRLAVLCTLEGALRRKKNRALEVCKCPSCIQGDKEAMEGDFALNGERKEELSGGPKAEEAGGESENCGKISSE